MAAERCDATDAGGAVRRRSCHAAWVCQTFPLCHGGLAGHRIKSRMDALCCGGDRDSPYADRLLFGSRSAWIPDMDCHWESNIYDCHVVDIGVVCLETETGRVCIEVDERES